MPEVAGIYSAVWVHPTRNACGGAEGSAWLSVMGATSPKGPEPDLVVGNPMQPVSSPAHKQLPSRHAVRR
jgi:hypothetical protein